MSTTAGCCCVSPDQTGNRVALTTVQLCWLKATTKTGYKELQTGSCQIGGDEAELIPHDNKSLDSRPVLKHQQATKVRLVLLKVDDNGKRELEEGRICWSGRLLVDDGVVQWTRTSRPVAG